MGILATVLCHASREKLDSQAYTIETMRGMLERPTSYPPPAA